VGAAGEQTVDLGELGVGRIEADVQALGLAGPAFLDRFGDAGGEVVSDLDQARPLVRVYS
jgi:hypothetical protein